MDKIYTLQELAEKLKVSERSIFRYINLGKLKGSKLGVWRFTEKDVQDFLKSCASSKLGKKQ